jgi:DNA polymerase-3 subunit chi
MSVPRVDFYILSQTSPDADRREACRLSEQAYELGRKTFIRVANDADAQRVDELLWSFSDRAFVPHEIASSESPTNAKIAVLIGREQVPAGYDQLLINLCDDLPPEFEHCEQIAEIVPNEVDRKRLARDRFRQYRERGCTLESHNL